jgi:hypothetical protein
VSPFELSAVVLTVMLRRKVAAVDRQILRIVLPSHPLLGRNVNHDSASRSYRVQVPRKVDFRSVRHQSSIGILDQGSVGSCTGNAGTSAIYHAPYVSGVVKPWAYPASESGAVSLYSDATKVDPFAGSYPPTDTGSDGLSIAKVLKAKGIISGYLWAFTLDEALAQLMKTPLLTGIPWLNSMFDTTSDGHAGHVVVNQMSGAAGGHEICVDELVVGTATNRGDWFVGGPNSWGPGWGDGGRWYLSVPEWDWLLSQQGDVTALVPNTKPAPEPVPDPTDPATDVAGDTLWSATKSWATAPHTGGNARAAKAVRAWAKATNRS